MTTRHHSNRYSHRNRYRREIITAAAGVDPSKKYHDLHFGFLVASFHRCRKYYFKNQEWNAIGPGARKVSSNSPRPMISIWIMAAGWATALPASKRFHPEKWNTRMATRVSPMQVRPCSAAVSPRLSLISSSTLNASGRSRRSLPFLARESRPGTGG